MHTLYSPAARAVVPQLAGGACIKLRARARA